MDDATKIEDLDQPSEGALPDVEVFRRAYRIDKWIEFVAVENGMTVKIWY